MAEKEWFSHWFNSPYYHELYSHRDEEEAANFIRSLVQKMDFLPGSAILDLGCGNGRHVRTLIDLGFHAIGMDLAAESIEEARLKKKGQFFVGDMRKPFPVQQLDAVFNLFTSFGYFESHQENLNVLHNIHQALVEDGILVIDYLNAHKVIAHLKSEETIQKKGITYAIRRFVADGNICKNIRFTDREGNPWDVTEKVEALQLEHFQSFLNETGFKTLNTFGSLRLEPFDLEQSDRLIIIAQKV